MARTESDADPKFEVRKSRVHGRGVFALKHIKKGTLLIEYLGERISHEEADQRYADKDERDNHTFLFTVDRKTVIDAGVDGNEARFFNHSCDPNCESEMEKKRVWIRAIKDIEPGDEMTYDYQIVRDDDDPPNIDEIFACKCGAEHCRGTMLWPKPKKRKRKAPAKAKAPSQSKVSARTKGGPAVKTKLKNKAKAKLKSKAKAKGAGRPKSKSKLPLSRAVARGTGRASLAASPAARRKTVRR